MLVLGVDEAGRGPVMGSLLIGGVVDEEKSSSCYSSMGCKDSKMLAPQKREELAEKILEQATEVKWVEIPASEIDYLRKRCSLNEIEARKIAGLVMSLENPPEKLIIDCPDPRPKKFRRRLHKYLGPEVNAVIEHKADEKYPLVSAASIIAKVKRDASMRELEKRYGRVGTGYSHDSRTRDFLNKYFQENKKFPACVRKSWFTAQVFFDREFQKSLSDY